MPRDTKSKPDQSRARGHATPTGTLANLNQYLEAAGYGADHPWRLEIGAALAHPIVEQVQPDPLGHALDAVNVAGAGASFLNDNIYPVMSAIVEFSKSDSMDVGDNRSRMSQIKALARLGCQLVDEAAAHMESEQDEMHAKLAALQGGAA
jgi:hypothetical protein